MKFCPRCGSKDLKYMPWLGEIYSCKDCNYQGALIIENGEIAEAIRKKFEAEKRE